MAKKFQVVTRSTPIREHPDHFSTLTSELLYGETVETISHHGNFLKCININDGYEGYVIKEALSDDILTPNKKIVRMHSFVYSDPDFRTPTITYLSFLSAITTTGNTENGFSEIEGGGWLWSDDLAPMEHKAKNITTTAQMFLNLPYLWGGKTSRGVDCSGLVQLALHHAGQTCPRDSGDQEFEIHGTNVDFGNEYTPANLQKGDIVFFKGHVGIMMDESNIINATARTMDVRIEKLSDITKFYEGGVTKVTRL